MIDLNSDEFSPDHIWTKLLYNREHLKLDIYYLEGGYPKLIHDKYGASGIKEFRDIYIRRIMEENKLNNIWRVTSDGFAVNHKEDNISDFDIQYKDLNYSIKKMKVCLNS